MRKEVKPEFAVLPINVKKHLYFNRYKLELFESQLLMHFCLVHHSGVILDSYSSVIPRSNVRDSRKSIESYLTAANLIGDFEQKEYPFTTPARDVDSISFIQLSRLNDLAEIGMVCYSLNHYINAIKRNILDHPVVKRILREFDLSDAELPEHPVLCETVALLRCEPLLQKRLAIELIELAK